MSKYGAIENGQVAPYFKLGPNHEMAVNSTPNLTPAVGASTDVIWVYASGDALIAIGDNPVAGADSFHVEGGGVLPFLRIEPGQRVSARSATSNQVTVYITEML